MYKYIRKVYDDTIRAFKNDLIEQNWKQICIENEMNQLLINSYKYSRRS